MIGEHAQALEAEVDQNLRADSAFMLQEALPRRILIELAASVVKHASHFAGTGGRLLEAEASPGVVQINEDAAIFAYDGFERSRDDLIAIAGARAENVSGEAMRMHAHERRRARKIAAHQGDVLFAIHLTRENDHAEIAVARSQYGFRDAPDVTLMAHSIADQFRHGEQLEIVRAAEFGELRKAGHAAVIIHDLADYARGIKARDARQVHGSF